MNAVGVAAFAVPEKNRPEIVTSRVALVGIFHNWAMLKIGASYVKML